MWAVCIFKVDAVVSGLAVVALWETMQAGANILQMLLSFREIIYWKLSGLDELIPPASGNTRVVSSWIYFETPKMVFRREKWYLYINLCLFAHKIQIITGETSHCVEIILWACSDCSSRGTWRGTNALDLPALMRYTFCNITVFISATSQSALKGLI